MLTSSHAYVRADLDERGAVLAVVGIVLSVILVAGALAVDISALENRGQVLQNTSDAAALVGVAVWTDTGSQEAARNAVRDLINQNGVTDDDVELQVDFPSATEVTISLRDPSPDVFLSGRLLSPDGVVRDATASLETCLDCSRDFATAPPFQAIIAAGAGDGYIPIPVGNKLYAINHHGNTIGCADRITSSICWAPRNLFPGETGIGTGFTSHAHAHEGRIFYTGSDEYNRGPRSTSDVIVTCWDTATDANCGDRRVLTDEIRGVIVGKGDRFWVFTARHQVFCYMTADLSNCSGYAGGRPMATDGSTVETDGMEHADQVMDGDKIYLTPRYDGQYHLTCWDTAAASPCAGFGVKTLSGEGQTSGRLFVHRDASGAPNGVCALSITAVECFDRDTGAATAQGDAFDELLSARSAKTFYGTGGAIAYHPPTNRFFISAGWPASFTFCWDFETGYCGERTDQTAYGPAETYGYIADGPCMVGFGDNAIFFTFSPVDFGTCNSGALEQVLSPCGCSIGANFPPLRAANLEGVASFRIQVEAADGTIIVPSDGSDWLDITDGRVIDLASLAPDRAAAGETVMLRAAVEAEVGKAPWARRVPPTLRIGRSDDFLPTLTE